MISHEKLIVPTVLGALCVSICILIVIITRSTTEDIAAPSATLEPAILKEHYLPAPSYLREARLRPMFDPTRRPPAPPAPQDVATASLMTALDQHLLTAIISRPGAAQVQVKAPDDTGPAEWLQIGDNYKGWTLQSIGRDNATFTERGRETTLFLFPSHKANEERLE